MNTADQVQILDKTICISSSANILVEVMSLTILPPAMDK